MKKVNVGIVGVGKADLQEQARRDQAGQRHGRAAA